MENYWTIKNLKTVTNISKVILIGRVLLKYNISVDILMISFFFLNKIRIFLNNFLLFLQTCTFFKKRPRPKILTSRTQSEALTSRTGRKESFVWEKKNWRVNDSSLFELKGITIKKKQHLKKKTEFILLCSKNMTDHWANLNAKY